MGYGAGCLPHLRGKRELALLASYAGVACFVYGLLMNLWFWPFGAGAATTLSFQPGAGLIHNLVRFLVFDATTSLGFDLPRALLNAGLVLMAGRPVLAALRRASHRAAFGAPIEITGSQSFEPLPATELQRGSPQDPRRQSGKQARAEQAQP
jgi:energy-coupling factor transport system substrate-specific component